MKTIQTLFITLVITSIISFATLISPSGDSVQDIFIPKVHPILQIEVVVEDSTEDTIDTEAEVPIELSGKELYVSYIYQICELYFSDLDPVVVQAVMEAESNYIPTLESRCGAVGLMQVIPKWHAWRMDKYNLVDIWDPWTNIIVGMSFIDESFHKYGNYRDALFEYNHSWAYVDYVLKLADHIRQGGEQNGETSGNIA